MTLIEVCTGVDGSVRLHAGDAQRGLPPGELEVSIKWKCVSETQNVVSANRTVKGSAPTRFE
jgi:hypothetical protein